MCLVLLKTFLMTKFLLHTRWWLKLYAILEALNTYCVFLQLDKNLAIGCVRCSVDEREHSERDEGAQVPRWKSKGICVSKNLDETVRLQFEKREEWIREIRGERDYKGLQRVQVALPVWPAHQPRCSPGETHVRGSIVAL